MKFSNRLDASMVPEWRPYYINYKALKKKLKQAQAEHANAVDFLAASPQTTSLSIARSLATASPRHASTLRQQLDSSAAGVGPEPREQQEQQQQQQQQQEQPVFFSAYGLAPSGTAQEQFLQMLQQDLANVRDFIVAQAAALSSALEALAGAAPQMAMHAADALEQEAQCLGQKLLALEQFVNINQTGFVKIVKKHDKLLPDSPVWHLYLHHLQKTPWPQEQQRQFMWAALSSCYYHYHASILASSRRRGSRQQQQQRDDKSQLSSRAPSVTAATVPPAAAAAGGEDASGKASSRFLPSALGAAVAGAATAAVAGAASAVAGAATAVAGAATAVAGAAAAAATSRPGTAAAARDSSPPAVNFTRKFWVAQEDVSAVMYTILQHLPLLPCTSHSSAGKQQLQQAGFGTRHATAAAAGTRHATAAAAAAAATTGQQQQQQLRGHQQLQEFAGFTTTLHTVYFDNKGLELYHGRLYFRPNTLTLKARWIGHNDEFWAPAKVVLERKVYREGWKGERNIKDALLIAGEVFPAYLVGTYSLGDALSQLHELPALQQTLQQTLSSLQQRRQQRQAAQHKQLQLQQQSPFAAVNAAAEAAAAAAAADGQAGSSGGVGSTGTAAADAEVNAALAAAGVRVPAGTVLGASFSRNSNGGWSILGKSFGSQRDLATLQQQQQQQADCEVPVQLQLTQQQQHMYDLPRVPQVQEQQQGREISSTGQQQQQQPVLSLPELSHPANTDTSALSIPDSSDDDSGSEDEEQGHIRSTDTYAAGQQHPGNVRLPAGTSAAAVAGDGSGSSITDPFTDGFEDAYLDPPMPSADQLSLFIEVQKLVAQKRLQPILHCVLQRMLFAMPFDDRIKITLDTDVASSAVAHYQLLQKPLKAAAAGVPLNASGQSAVRTGSVITADGQLHVASQEAAAADPQSSQQVAELVSRQGSSKATSLLAMQLQQQQQHKGASGGDVAAGGVFDMFNLPYDPATLDQEDVAYDTWESIYSATNSSSYHHSAARRSSTGGTDLTYGMPYALLKVSVDLPAGQNPPGWLLQLMDSELLSPVEDWSKFVHGCAVLLPEAVRAVPYWIDDPLVDLSIQAIQSELETTITKREEQVKLAAMAAAAAARGQSKLPIPQLQQQQSIGRNSFARQLSGVLARNLSGVSSAQSQGVLSPESQSGTSSQQSSAGGALNQQQQQLLQQRSSRISRLRHSSSTGGLHQMDELQQQQQQQLDVAAGMVSSSEISPIHHRVTWGGNLPLHPQAQGLGHSRAGASSSSLAQLEEPATPPVAARSLPRDQQQFAAGSGASTPRDSAGGTAAAAAAAADASLSGRQLVRRLRNLIQSRKNPPPLFRPEGYIQGGWRKRWGHPVQLLECREFFHSEAVFLEWLRLAITMASVAILLLGYSAMAYVNPLKKPMIHVAEIITLLMLPSSCIIVAYAIRVYIWRGKRLHSMRYRRVDDQVGPNLMTAVFVTAMLAIFLVNMADLLLILKYRSKRQGDDPEQPDEPELVWLFTQPYTLLQHLL